MEEKNVGIKRERESVGLKCTTQLKLEIKNVELKNEKGKCRDKA